MRRARRRSRSSSKRPPRPGRIELKSITVSAFFTSDPGNPDTYNHVFADLQMLAIFPGVPAPQRWIESLDVFFTR